MNVIQIWKRWKPEKIRATEKESEEKRPSSSENYICDFATKFVTGTFGQLSKKYVRLTFGTPIDIDWCLCQTT